MISFVHKYCNLKRTTELNAQRFRMQINIQDITLGKGVGGSAEMHLFVEKSIHILPTFTLGFTYILKHLTP